MIGREQALDIYLSVSKKAKIKIEHISKWDSAKSLKENACDVGLSYPDAYALCKKYGLSKK